MKALVAVLVALSGPVAAETLIQSGGDTIEIREAEGVAAEVVYNNGESQNSKSGKFELEVAGVVVDVEIRVNDPGKENMETVLVVPRDSGLIAIPPEADIPDGESVTVQIMLPMF